MLTQATIKHAQLHARAEFPKESCGLVLGDDSYLACQNIAEDPLVNFEIRAGVYLSHARREGVKAVLHSHPNGPMYPSRTDMESQIQLGVAFGIIPLDAERIGAPIMWGDSLPIAPIIGREFIHGVADCYSIVRDAFRLGKDGLAAQGVTGWPYKPLVLPEVPRDDNWWTLGEDLYSQHFKPFGFKVIDRSEARGGDVFFCKIFSDKFNHAGVLTDEGLILHHLAKRLSRREPANTWGRAAGLWIRQEHADVA